MSFKFGSDYQRISRSPGYICLAWWMLDQSFWVILCYRCLSVSRNRLFNLLIRPVEKIAEFLFKCYIPSTASIDKGLIIYHAFGIVINGKAVIGKNCTMYARVCIGSRWPGDSAPWIGDNVTIGTGACIFGPVKIPTGSVVRANAVVTPSDLSGVVLRDSK